MRRRYVYRLNVQFPPLCDVDNPKSWFVLHPGTPPNVDPRDRERFHWPQHRRRFFDESSAYRRARLLEHYGCRATVERSKPIEFV